MYIQRPARRSRLGKVVYPSSFNYLINSVSSIIFARVIKPQAKVNNSCTSSSRSRKGAGEHEEIARRLLSQVGKKRGGAVRTREKRMEEGRGGKGV